MYKVSKFTFVDGTEIAAPDVKEGIVYVDNENKVAILKCPCGCGEIIMLNLIPDTHPSWIVMGTTIKPSIQKLTGCKSHFSIINGEVK